MIVTSRDLAVDCRLNVIVPVLLGGLCADGDYDVRLYERSFRAHEGSLRTSFLCAMSCRPC